MKLYFRKNLLQITLGFVGFIQAYYFLDPFGVVFGGLVRDAWNGIPNRDVSADAQGKICKVVFIISFSSFGLV
jgi:hypothetical protein